MEADIHWLTATELGRRIAAHEISPVEVTEAMLARIERLDPGLHAYVVVLADRAVAQAKRAADGMQASLQLIGRHLAEETLIAAGHAYQQATDWHNRRPPVR